MKTIPIRSLSTPLLPACIVAVALTVNALGAAPQTNRLTASQLLSKFTQTHDRITSFLAEWEFSRRDEVLGSAPWKGQHWEVGETRYDGCRLRERDRLWGQIVPDTVRSKDKPYYRSWLFDGQWRYQYDQPVWRVEDIRDRRQGTGILMLGRKPARPMDLSEALGRGALYLAWGGLPNDAKRIDARLQQAPAIRVREKLEPAGWNSSPCYVLEAHLPDAQHYTIWLDPACGFHMAKGILRRTAGYRPSSIYTLWGGEFDLSFVEKVRFAKQGDLWIPIEATGGLDNVRRGFSCSFRFQLKVTKFLLNPDHDALRSFEPDDIRNGAKVFYPNQENKPPGVWQDGRVVDKTGQVIMTLSPKLIEQRQTTKEQLPASRPGL